MTTESTQTNPSRHDQLQSEYGTLNPHLALLTSDALEAELDAILDTSRACTAKTLKADGGNHTVTVELTFDVDDFPEVFD